MESRIPLPTDNIYKFYALFGLLLSTFAVGAMIYVTKSTNSLLFDVAAEYEALESDPLRSAADDARFRMLQKKVEIAGTDKSVFKYSLSVVLALGVFMAWYGFRKWHTEIQPIQDEIARLTLKKLRHDVGEG